MQLSPPALRLGNPSCFALVAIAAVALPGYFVLPGWLSAAVVLFDLLALALILQPGLRHELRRVLGLSQVRWMLVALSAPLLAITITALAHQELLGRRFEGPVRLFLAGAALLVLLIARVDFSRVAAWALPASLTVCAAWVFYPGSEIFYWNGRAATVFMDPITLSQHTVVFGFMCALLVGERTERPQLQRLLLLAAFSLALAVAVRTQSRTGWLIVPVAALLVVLKHSRSRNTHLPLALLALLALLVAVYFAIPNVRFRIGEAINEVWMYMDGGSRDTSIGVRLSLFRTNLILFTERPLFGWGYALTPDITSIAAVRQFHTPLFHQYWLNSGGHNEYLQSMMRMGVVGLAARLLVLGIPLLVFASATRSGDANRRRNGFLGLVVTLGYLMSGMTVEVFNLSYSVSLYALLVAVFAAGALPNPAPTPLAATQGQR